MLMTVEIKGLDKLQKKLGNLQNFSRWAYAPMEQAVAIIEDDVKQYPQKRAGAFSSLATPAQKRAYWAKVRSGEITHGAGGYRRTGTLGRKWVSEVKNMPNGVQGVIGNNTEYAKYVHGNANQQLFHFASGWKDENRLIMDNEAAINKVFQVAVSKELAK